MDDVILLDTVSDNPATAMRAGRRQLVDCAFETVERVGLAIQNNLECLVVIISAEIASGHDNTPFGVDRSFINPRRRLPFPIPLQSHLIFGRFQPHELHS